MMSIFTYFYLKLAGLVSTFVPSASDVVNDLGMKILGISNTKDPGLIIEFIFESILMMIAIFVIFPLTLLYRLFMGLIGQPIPVPWF